MRVTLNPLKAITIIRESLRTLRQLRQTKKALQQLLQQQTPTDIHAMSAMEFYAHITDTTALQPTSEQFYQFLLDYVITAYVHGELEEAEMQRLLGSQNPLQLGRFVDRMIRDARMKGSFMEELVAHAMQTKEEASPLYTMLFSPTEYDPHTGSFMVKTFADVKKILSEHQQTLQDQKQQLAVARMRAAEKQRQDEARRIIAMNNPEAVEATGTDAFVTEDQQLEHDARILHTEIQKQAKGTVIRSAMADTHKVQSPDMQQLSPAEQIAYKKKLLAKVRREDGQAGMNIRI